MRKKIILLAIIFLLLSLLTERWCYYNLPVELPHLYAFDENCTATVIPIRGDEVLKDEEFVLSQEQLTNFMDFIKDTEFSRMIQQDEMKNDADIVYTIKIDPNNGSSQHIGFYTNGGTILGYVYEPYYEQFQVHDENWHFELEKLLME